MTAKNAITGDQLTKHFCGATLSQSAVASNDLLRAVIYPDSTDTDPTGSDQLKFQYNLLGEVTKKTLSKHTGEATATVHDYVYDKVGRLLHAGVAAFGAGIDQTVKRVTPNYEIRGMLAKISSYDHATPGSGTIVNEVQFAYNDFSLLTADHQSHSGAVVIGSTPKVQYAYADGSASHTRPTSLTYPDSRVVTLDYGTAGGGDDLLCRVASLKQGTTVLAGYGYPGVNLPIRLNYSDQPGVELTYLKQGGESNGDAGDQYTGLDRFGRLVDQRWFKTNDGTNREREWVQYSFDRASNRVWRANRVGTGNQDEYYTCDNLYQLKTMKRGNLNAGKTDISGTPVWQEDWNYDPTGNWRGTTSAYVTRTNGSTTLNRNRSHDKANELLTITGTPDWFDPTASGYDGAGNMIKVPQAAAPTTGCDCKYDAWDRLVEVKVTGGAVVATYRYDGLKRRVTKVAGGNTRHYYHSNRWQVLQERLNALSTADRQFVWGLRHVDELIERDRGSERFYVLHDHLSVTAIINTAGAVQERYGYDGFGPQRVMDASFGAYRLDTEAGLCQVRHRLYHPKLGRWISTDPLGYRDGLTTYAYVLNRPLKNPDRRGLGVSYHKGSRALGDNLSKRAQQLMEGAEVIKKCDPNCPGAPRLQCRCDGPCQDTSRPAGVYDQRTNTIIICYHNVKDTAELTSTLLHELTHVYVKCAHPGATGPSCRGCIQSTLAAYATDGTCDNERDKEQCIKNQASYSCTQNRHCTASQAVKEANEWYPVYGTPYP